MAKSKHFMVVLCGDFSHRLEIPRNFLRHIEKVSGKLDKGPMPVKLAGPTGRTWCVFIERAANRTHFTSGWPKFARDHKLKENQFVVFRYDGSWQFSVVIFDETLCEREIMISEEVAKQAPEVVSLSDSEWSESSDSDKDPDEDEEDDENEDYETDSLAMNKSKKRRTSSSSLSSRPSSSSKKMRGKYVSRRRAVTDLEKRMAAEAAFSFASKKPYCMIHMSANMVYRWASLRFPMRFSRKYLPRKKTKFVLKNSAGKEWMGSYFTEVGNTYKGLISRGWTHFARDNNLEEDDYCVFELVNSKEFLVHIFRVVEEVVPPVWTPK